MAHGPDGLVELLPTPGARARVSCGCEFTLVIEQAFDLRAARWIDRQSVVVVACTAEHVALAREAMAATEKQPNAVAQIEEAARQMETLLP